MSRDLTALRASAVLPRVRATNAVTAARRRIAVELLDDLRRVDADLAELKTRISVTARGTGAALAIANSGYPAASAHTESREELDDEPG